MPLRKHRTAVRFPKLLLSSRKTISSKLEKNEEESDGSMPTRIRMKKKLWNGKPREKVDLVVPTRSVNSETEEEDARDDISAMATASSGARGLSKMDKKSDKSQALVSLYSRQRTTSSFRHRTNFRDSTIRNRIRDIYFGFQTQKEKRTKLKHSLFTWLLKNGSTFYAEKVPKGKGSTSSGSSASTTSKPITEQDILDAGLRVIQRRIREIYRSLNIRNKKQFLHFKKQLVAWLKKIGTTGELPPFNLPLLLENKPSYMSSNESRQAFKTLVVEDCSAKTDANSISGRSACKLVETKSQDVTKDKSDIKSIVTQEESPSDTALFSTIPKSLIVSTSVEEVNDGFEGCAHFCGALLLDHSGLVRYTHLDEICEQLSSLKDMDDNSKSELVQEFCNTDDEGDLELVDALVQLLSASGDEESGEQMECKIIEPIAPPAASAADDDRVVQANDEGKLFDEKHNERNGAPVELTKEEGEAATNEPTLFGSILNMWSACSKDSTLAVSGGKDTASANEGEKRVEDNAKDTGEESSLASSFLALWCSHPLHGVDPVVPMDEKKTHVEAVVPDELIQESKNQSYEKTTSIDNASQLRHEGLKEEEVTEKVTVKKDESLVMDEEDEPTKDNVSERGEGCSTTTCAPNEEKLEECLEESRDLVDNEQTERSETSIRETRDTEGDKEQPNGEEIIQTEQIFGGRSPRSPRKKKKRKKKRNGRFFGKSKSPKGSLGIKFLAPIFEHPDEVNCKTSEDSTNKREEGRGVKGCANEPEDKYSMLDNSTGTNASTVRTRNLADDRKTRTGNDGMGQEQASTATDETPITIDEKYISDEIEESDCDGGRQNHDNTCMDQDTDEEEECEENDGRSFNSQPTSNGSVDFSQTLSKTLSSHTTHSDSLACTSGSYTGNSSTFSDNESYDESESGSDDDGYDSFSDGEDHNEDEDESSDDEEVEDGDREEEEEEDNTLPRQRSDTLRSKVANGIFRGRNRRKHLHQQNEGEDSRKKEEEISKKEAERAEEAKQLEKLKKEVEILKLEIQNMKRSDNAKKSDNVMNQSDNDVMFASKDEDNKKTRSWSTINKMSLSPPRAQADPSLLEDHRDEDVGVEAERYEMPSTPCHIEDNGRE